MIEFTAFRDAPVFAHGLARDIRVRWACEEIGLPYRTRLLDAFAARPDDYYREQPFGQIPAYREGSIQLFETGAILLHIGGKDERLLPCDDLARGRAICWLFAALNSVEPALANLVTIDVFAAGEEWARLSRPPMEAHARTRLSHLSRWLGQQDWLEGDFTIADVMMICVLRIIRHTELVSEFPNLRDYCARGEARPAFKRALAQQIRDLSAAGKIQNPTSKP
jgi:glutathione S-transferase